MSKRATPTKQFPVWARWFVIAAILVVAFSSASLALSIHMENNDQFCASCHTSPETTYVDRSSQAPIDLASAHAAEGVGCIQCHSGAGATGRLDALQLGATDVIAFVGKKYPQPTHATHPIPDENCLKCHSDIGTAQTFENHFHVLLPRWQQVRPDASATCVDCHSAHTTDGRSDIAWVSVNPAQAQCNACHQIMGD